MPRLMNSLNTENSIHCDNNIIIGDMYNEVLVDGDKSAE